MILGARGYKSTWLTWQQPAFAPNHIFINQILLCRGHQTLPTFCAYITIYQMDKSP